MRITRNRDISRSLDIGRLDPRRPAGDRRFVGQVVKVTVDPAKGKYALCQPCGLDFPESEGASVALPAYGVPVPVAVLNGTPAVGDYLICTAASGGRWIADRSGGTTSPGGGGVVVPGCSCTSPYTIDMLSRSPTCNFGMFQSCTLQYHAYPPGFLDGFSTSRGAWFSANSFTSSIDPNHPFYYVLQCDGSQYGLYQYYPPKGNSIGSLQGAQYVWAIGNNTIYGRNTCSPFLLPGGTAFPGSDSSCSNQLSASATQVITP